MSSSSQRSPTDVMSFCHHRQVHTAVKKMPSLSDRSFNPSSDLHAQQPQQEGDILWPIQVVRRHSNINMTNLKEHASHPCHIHEHDARVDARPAVEGVAGEAAVPGDTGLLMLRGHGGQLGGIKLGQECPQAVYRLQEEDV